MPNFYNPGKSTLENAERRLQRIFENVDVLKDIVKGIKPMPRLKPKKKK